VIDFKGFLNFRSNALGLGCSRTVVVFVQNLKV
jgi:hypothetical protein